MEDVVLSKKNILVVGDFCIDRFVYGYTERINPEAPIPIFKPTKIIENYGMAGNVASNLSSLGNEVKLLCNKEKIYKTRYVDFESNHMHLRVDENDYVNKEDSYKNIETYDLDEYDCIVITDHNKGFLEKKDILNISKNHKNVFLQTNRVLGKWAENVRFIKINMKEFRNSKQILENKNYEKLRRKVLVTDGSNGSYFNNEHYPIQKNVITRDLAGAGDTFISVFVDSCLKNKKVREAIFDAQKAAATVVQKRGVSVIGNKKVNVQFLN